MTSFMIVTSLSFLKTKTKKIIQLDNYQKATIEEPKKVDLMELFKMSGVNLQQMPPPLTPEQIEHMPIG